MGTHALAAGLQRWQRRYREEMRRDYEKLWSRSMPRLAKGYVDPDPVPEKTSRR